MAGRIVVALPPEDHFHHDIDSADVARVHPDLPRDAAARRLHQARCDAEAYRRVRDAFPALTPPGARDQYASASSPYGS